jgi:hypothetical protein
VSAASELSPRVIRLRTWPEPFQAVLDGRKPYEIRVNDRGFQVGDVLHLVEFDPKIYQQYDNAVLALTGREVRKLVTYMTAGGAWGLPPDLCVLGLGEVQP